MEYKNIDREYAVCFKGPNGLDEIGLGPDFFVAQKIARGYADDGATQVVLKHYEEGDLIHQWDLINGKWKKYE